MRWTRLLLLLAFLGAAARPAILSAGQIVFLISESDTYLVQRAIDGLRLPEGLKLLVLTPTEIQRDNATRDRVAGAEIVLVDVMVKALTDFLGEGATIAQKRVYALRTSRDDGSLKKAGYLFDEAVRTYYQYPSVKNIRNLVYRIASQEFDGSIKYEEPERLPELGAYHPEADSAFESVSEYLGWYRGRDGFDADAGWVAVMLFPTYVTEGHVAPVNYLIRRIEAEGLNALPVFGEAHRVIDEFLMDEKRKPRADVAVAFSLKFRSSLDEKLNAALVAMDIPVLNALDLYYNTIPEWRGDRRGLLPTEVAWAISTPEISGLIEPSVLMGRDREPAGNTGPAFFSHRAVEDNVEHLIPRLKRWIALRKKPNREKRIAILFYNHAQGKQNIGASYLNVFASLEQILKRMAAEGYGIEQREELDDAAIRDLILKYARNIGSWAPGELEKLCQQDKVVRVAMDTYRGWFSKLPEGYRSEVVRQWGDPEKSEIMATGGDFIVPAVILGNVVLMPEPSRGWIDDPVKLYHSPIVYPHHQYTAAYLWIRNVFQADAMIHLGTHATHEWLPGKQAGLTPGCPPEVLLTDLPNIYPYIVDNLGEAVQAKRRGRGVVVDHLTPAVREAGLYHEYRRLFAMLSAYSQATAAGSETAEAQLEEIGKLVGKMGIDRDLGLEALDTDALEQVEHYLLEIKTDFMPYGLHTFGVAPEGPALDDTVSSIVKQNKSAQVEPVRQTIIDSGPAEIERLIRGLDGRYIPPGEGNDPIRNPRAVPTGRNLYGFDPARIPSAAAFDLGRRAAEEIIRRSLKEKGKYPEKVAVILWATETFRNGGVNESTILHLMGLEPTWDRVGRISGVRPVPGAVLKRPRIDVLINPSGLYRDSFPNLLVYLDEAVQKAAALQDIENLIRKHSEGIRNRLTDQGMPREQAEALSRVRIFSEAPGAYGTGVSETASASGIWESDDEIAKVFVNHVGFAFGGGQWGNSARDVLRENLKGVDTAVHSLSSNIYGAMDNDDVFQYVGGLSLAVRKERGEAPDTLMTLQRTANKVGVENVSRTLGRELRARYLNPKWIEGMRKEGYAGAREMQNFTEYMWGWQVTIPAAIDEAKWREVYEVYVEDKYSQGIKKFLNEKNPWAYQAMTAWMLESVRKGYWKADDATTQRLAEEYATSVIEQGATCCCHACNNPLLNQMVSLILSQPGVLGTGRKEKSERFEEAIKKVTWQTLGQQIEERKKLQKTLQDGFGLDVSSGEDLASQDQRKSPDRISQKAEKPTPVDGFKMEVLNTLDGDSESSPEVRWHVYLVPLIVVILLALGALVRRARRES